MKSVQCDECGKSFSEPAYLKRHKCRARKVQCDNWQTEENEKPKDDMISLNGTAKNSQINNEKRKECDFCGNLILDDLRKHIPFVDICKP